MAKRAFRVWRAKPYDGLEFWRWECSLCRPPVYGGRYGPDAWRKIIEVSLPHHMRRRACHHRWVALNYGREAG